MRKRIGIAFLSLAVPFAVWYFLIRETGPPRPLPRKYRIEVLREEGGSMKLYPLSINEHSQVVGWARPQTPDSGVYWDRDRGFHLLSGILPIAINDSGQIDGMDPTGTLGIRMIIDATDPVEIARNPVFVPVANNNRGEAIAGGGFRAAVWDATGTLLDLNAGREPKIHLNWINDEGVIVGTIETPRQSMMLRHPDGRIEDLGLLSVHPRRINNLGQVTGVCTQHGSRYAFLWSREKGITLFGGPLDLGFRGYYPWGINDHTQIVGTRYEEVRVEWLHQVLVKSSQSISFSLTGWLNSHWPTSHSSAFLWEEGVLYDLNWFLPDGSEWTRFENASDINNKGEIVGVGVIDGEQVGFLMTPVEENEE